MEEQDDASKSSQQQLIADWYLCSKHRFLWKMIIAAGLVPVFVVLILRGVLIEPIRNRDIGRKEFRKLYEKPVAPESENAFEDYIRAFKTVTSEKVKFDLETKLEVWDGHDAQKIFDANATALNHLYRATEKKTCEMVFPGDDLRFINRPFSQKGSSMRFCVDLLLAHARWMAHNGDHRAAARDLKSLCVFSRHALHVGERSFFTIDSKVASVLQSILMHDPPKRPEDFSAYRESVTFREDPVETFGKYFEKLGRFAMIDFDNRYTDLGELDISWRSFHSGSEGLPYQLEYPEDRRERLLVYKRIQASIDSGRVDFK